MDSPGSDLGRGQTSLFPQLFDRLWGPPDVLFNEYPGVKRSEREADTHFHLVLNVNRKLLHIATTAQCLTRHRHNVLVSGCLCSANAGGQPLSALLP